MSDYQGVPPTQISGDLSFDRRLMLCFNAIHGDTREMMHRLQQDKSNMPPATGDLLPVVETLKTVADGMLELAMRERLWAEKDKAKAETEKIKAETEKFKAETEKIKAETEKIRAGKM